MRSKYSHLANKQCRPEIDFWDSQLQDDELCDYVQQYDEQIYQDIKSDIRYRLERAGTGFGGGMAACHGTKAPDYIVEESVEIWLANNTSRD